MPRREDLYLLDILESADEVASFLAGVEREAFLADNMRRAAVLYRMIVIGEAASHLPARLRARHPEIPWSRVIAFRNIVVHTYFATDWSVVWDAATGNVPDLRRSIAAIIAQEYPDLQIPDPPPQD